MYNTNTSPPRGGYPPLGAAPAAPPARPTTGRLFPYECTLAFEMGRLLARWQALPGEHGQYEGSYGHD